MSQTVQRAITILELIAERPRTPAEVGEQLGIHRTTGLRLLQTLQDGGLVRRQPDGTFGVGFRLTGLAQLALDQFDIAAVAHPHLLQLKETCGHTVHLAALEGNAMVYVDKVEPVNTVRMHSQIGHQVCLHTAGVSKAILAFLPAGRLDLVLDGHDFARHTETTITSVAAFRQELDEVRMRGWAADNAEFEDYVNCIAAPVRGAGSGVVAAVSVTALRARADLQALKDLLPALQETTYKISSELGWRP